MRASIRAVSVPGNGCRNQSAASAVAVRSGSITTTFAPLALACSMNGQRWRLVSLVLVPHRSTSRAWRTLMGSAVLADP